MTVSILVGDCVEQMKLLPSGSMQMCVTSPPYFGLRDYGVDGQIGRELTPDEFVSSLVIVFREVKRLLKDDGTLWLNIGDSYARTGGTDKKPSVSATVGSTRNTLKQNSDRKQNAASIGLKAKDLVGVPWMLAFALRADGWYLRQEIIWHKTNAMPESVKDRCVKAHEQIFLLTKKPKYYFDYDAVREPAVKGASGSKFNKGKTATHQLNRASEKDRAETATRNKRSVWAIATQPFAEAHFATFPPSLIEPCILAGSRFGDTVLDPFGGAGTTGLVSQQHGRDAVLTELNPEYAEIARRRIGTGAFVL